MNKRLKILVATILCVMSMPMVMAQSQYFGQNKPRYKKIDFRVLQSPHYELYHYFDDKDQANKLMIDSEHWYKLHQEVFKLAFITPNPLIIYKNHPDFQETTAIGGQIGEGTGGVTEGLRNRVIMPMMYTHRQTDHVLGHELVHAFQYKTMAYGSDSTTMASIGNLPLFMVEGLAEYMSIGREDSHTAMWMRDAVESGDIPTIEDLVTKQYKYFPYRWGQAFWAYVTATYGDDIIRPLFKETAMYGVQAAFKRSFSMDLDRFSAKFKQSLIDSYTPLKAGTETEARGLVLASEETGSEMNVSPTISPDGKYIAYISSKNVLSLDIYIADAETGKTIKKISSNSFAGHVDSYSFIETAGTWSPDSKHLAIVVQSKGKNKLSIINTANGSKKTYAIKGVDAFTNPTWSPDGNSVVVSGLVEALSDLYQFNLKSKEVENLTNDEFSDIQPSWSADGKYIYFVTDREGAYARLEKANLSISRYDVASKKVENLNILKGADNFNPVADPTGENIVFLSDRDGYRNIYKYNLASQELIKLTNYYTGVSGITMFSPAISMASATGDIAYSYFLDGAYSIVKAKSTDLLSEPIDNSVDKIAGRLAPFDWKDGRDLVQSNLNKQGLVSRTRTSSLLEKNYSPRFNLDYLANSGLGASTSRFGTGVGGGVTALFSDMLNNNQLSATVALNGEIQDFGGQIFYLNQKNPLQFGASVSHIPYQILVDREKYYSGTFTTIEPASQDLRELAELSYSIARIFIDEVSLFAFKPLSKTKRFEIGTSFNNYSASVKKYSNNYRVTRNSQGIVDSSRYTGEIYRTKLKPEEYPDDFKFERFGLFNTYVALVGDNSTFGTVAPLNGYRYRIQAGQYYGNDIKLTEVLIDARKYYYLNPFTVAGRFLYNGRFSPENFDILNQVNPLDLSFPWHMHGFREQYLTNLPFGQTTESNYRGEQIGLVNFEVRLPFTGPKQLALIPFNFLPSDLNFFVDAGLAHSSNTAIGDMTNVKSKFFDNFNQNVIFSTGASLRINVLGYLILEPYFALPFYNGGKKPVVTGVNFMIPGW
ncbi:DPP IV N-terminal domain-containing protein [Arcticibacterium luteifluviistationis]|uniref:TolB protein n=1 Tax=Arcticibacterium luteifluviistationis TaxID=1784714 RepID=A0A2Z4G6Y4_9BACT|nr:DPP IV N-terminal domain-containing protein [Arcticibacterium luteifluviistationis]AWV96908.1 tolB protein precursor [Arcticibacterium luteifluviistationis]